MSCCCVVCCVLCACYVVCCVLLCFGVCCVLRVACCVLCCILHIYVVFGRVELAGEGQDGGACVCHALGGVHSVRQFRGRQEQGNVKREGAGSMYHVNYCNVMSLV
jgi:hypothetical protein